MLIGGSQPVEKGLPSGESEGANGHSQTSAAHDFLKFLRDGFQSGGIVTTIQGTRIFHILLTITALSRKADVISADTICIFQSLNEGPDCT